MASLSTQRQTNLKAIKRKPHGAKARLEKLIIDVGSIASRPWFLSAISAILLLTIPAAQATLLKGCVQTDVFSDLSPEPANQADKDNGSTAAAANPAAADTTAAARANSFPVSFAGTWRCVTVVVRSAITSVPVGETIESAVSFIKQPDGRVLGVWEQPGWTEARQHVRPVSENEASMERTNIFLEQSDGGQWAARSQDHYLKLDNSRMAAESTVEQFVGGRFMGRYETRSMLYRLDIASRQ